MDLIVLLSVAIIGLLVWRAVAVVRSEKDTPRGHDPANGDATIISEYSSGAGGGQYSSYTVPSDPQDYAAAFVPKNRKSQK